jgi:hypothetical protein
MADGGETNEGAKLLLPMGFSLYHFRPREANASSLGPRGLGRGAY